MTADVVFGELFRLRHPAELLREFDMYEACGEGFPEPTEYIRQMVSVTRADGGITEAWTYVYNWPVTEPAPHRLGTVFDRLTPGLPLGLREAFGRE